MGLEHILSEITQACNDMLCLLSPMQILAPNFSACVMKVSVSRGHEIRKGPIRSEGTKEGGKVGVSHM